MSELTGAAGLRLETVRLAVLTLAGLVAMCVAYVVSVDLGPAWLVRVTRHVRSVDARLRYLRIRISAARIACAEAALLVSAACSMLAEWWLLLPVFIAPVIVLNPLLDLACSRRTSRIEEQLDHWLSGLAGSLRVSPALGQALLYSCSLVSSPLRDELIAATEELSLGVAVDEALSRMARRIGSRTVQSAVGTLRIGRNSGGELPGLLERSAGVLREMARLEGVFRTKTAEGRAQASVVSVMPFGMLALLHFIDPAFTGPLFATARGHLVLLFAAALWIAQIFIARRILRVDY